MMSERFGSEGIGVDPALASALGGSHVAGLFSTARTLAFDSEDMHAQVRELQAEAELGLPRTAFPWLHTDDAHPGKQQLLTITPKEIAWERGIPREALKDFLEVRIQKLEACRSLPFTILLVLSFASTATIHDAAPTIRAVEDSLAFDVDDNANFAVTLSDLDGSGIGHKGLNDVHSHLDFWLWMQGFVSLIFQEGASFHEGHDPSVEPYVSATEEGFIPRRERGYWLFYNRIVGGVRLVQERDEEIDCVTPLRVMRQPEIKCVGGYDYNLDPEVGLPANRAENTLNPQRERWLYVTDDADVVNSQVLQMEAEQWLDRKTRKIEIAIPAYNAEFGVHTLVRVNFYFSRGGHLWKQILPSSQFSGPPSTWLYLFSDGLWIMCLLYMFSSEVVEITRILRAGGIGHMGKYVTNIWNVIDWLTVLGGFFIIVTYTQSLEMAAELNSDLTAVGELDPIDDEAEFRDAVHDYVDILEDNVEYYRLFRRTMFLYPYIIIARLFKSFAKQPKLALVTRTLQLSAPDLVHFGIVCAAVFTVFMICGIVIFGREVRNFTEAPRAAVACFRVMLGDIDWAELSAVGRSKATMWLWLYTIIVVLLMLNMVLAIIMDNYSAVKEEASSGTTVWDDAYEVFAQWRGVRQGEVVPLEDILSAVESFEAPSSQKSGMLTKMSTKLMGPFSARSVTRTTTQSVSEDSNISTPVSLFKVDTLMRAYETRYEKACLMDEQAESVLTEAIEYYYEKHKHQPEINDVLRLIRQVKARVKKMVSMTNELHQVRDAAAVEELRWFSRDLDAYLEAVQKHRDAHRKEIDRLREKKARMEDELLKFPPRDVFQAVEEQEGDSDNASFKKAHFHHSMRHIAGHQLQGIMLAVGNDGQAHGRHPADTSLQLSARVSFGDNRLSTAPIAGNGSRSGELPGVTDMSGVELPPRPPLVEGPAPAEDEQNPDSAWLASDDEFHMISV